MAFQSTPAHGGRLHTSGCSLSYNSFQSTPAHGGRQAASAQIHLQTAFQSTPAHGGRRRVNPTPAVSIFVSIHARTRRATLPTAKFFVDERVSIHARTRRATLAPFVLLFNIPLVSIHARTRRATQSQQRCTCVDLRFNPRPHTAGDMRP